MLKLTKRSLSPSSSSKLLLYVPTNTEVIKCLKFLEREMDVAGLVLTVDQIDCFQLEEFLYSLLFGVQMANR